MTIWIVCNEDDPHQKKLAQPVKEEGFVQKGEIVRTLGS